MFDSAVVKFDEQYKLKQLAASNPTLPSPVVGFAWQVQSLLEAGELDATDALYLWALRN